MKFLPTHIYRVYNQGNNQEVIFKSSGDYLNFLTKGRILIASKCKMLAYCLMPNHFHFLLKATECSAAFYRIGNVETNQLSNGFRLLLSEYAQEYNNVNNCSGSLFRQKTKAKNLTAEGGIDAGLSALIIYIIVLLSLV